MTATGEKRREIVRRYQERHPERFKEIKRRYQESDAGKAAIRRYLDSPKAKATSAAYRIRQTAENPAYRIRRNAHQAVYVAKQRGLLVAQPCQECGSTTSQAHHHKGYANPLDVLWLCPKHHKHAHMAMAA